MAHRWHYSDWDERRKRQDPLGLLRRVGLEEGQVFIDLGSGNGFFSIPAAGVVGRNGRVYALDANTEAIEFLEGKAGEGGLGNIISRVGMAEDNILCDQCGDMVFFAEVLHDFQDPELVLKNAYRMIKPGGKLVDMDWKKEHGSRGPPYRIRFSEERASELITGAGFTIDSVEEYDAHHYLIMGRKR